MALTAVSTARSGVPLVATASFEGTAATRADHSDPAYTRLVQTMLRDALTPQLGAAAVDRLGLPKAGDKDFGTNTPQTQAVTRMLQESQGLTVDGMVGNQTLGELQRLRAGGYKEPLRNLGTLQQGVPTALPQPPAATPSPTLASVPPTSVNPQSLLQAADVNVWTREVNTVLSQAQSGSLTCAQAQAKLEELSGRMPGSTDAARAPLKASLDSLQQALAMNPLAGPQFRARSEPILEVARQTLAQPGVTADTASAAVALARQGIAGLGTAWQTDLDGARQSLDALDAQARALQPSSAHAPVGAASAPVAAAAAPPVGNPAFRSRADVLLSGAAAQLRDKHLTAGQAEGILQQLRGQLVDLRTPTSSSDRSYVESTFSSLIAEANSRFGRTLDTSAAPRVRLSADGRDIVSRFDGGIRQGMDPEGLRSEASDRIRSSISRSAMSLSEAYAIRAHMDVLIKAAQLNR